MPPTNSTFQPNTSYQTDMVGLTGADVNYSSINGAIGFNIYDPRLRLWSSRRQRAQELKNLHESSWQLYWAWYRNATDPLTDPADWWRSNEQIPTPFKIVETLLPRYILGMFDSPDYFVVEARNGRSEIYETLVYNLLRQQTEEMMLFPNLYEALRYSTVMGHCWGKVIWREEYSTRQTMRPYDMTVKEAVEGELGGEAVQQLAALYGEEVLEQPSGIKGVEAVVIEEEDFNGPSFEWRPLDRVFPDPTGKGKWYIEEIDTTIDELLDTQASLDVYDQEVLNNLIMSMHTSARNAQGGGVDGLGDMRSGTSAGVSIEYQREPETTEGIPEWIVSPMREGRGVKLWQCWGWVPPEMRQADGSAWRLTVIAEGKYVLRDDPSPTPDGKPPYFPIKSIAIPGRLYGESILHYVGPLSDKQ